MFSFNTRFKLNKLNSITEINLKSKSNTVNFQEAKKLPLRLKILNHFIAHNNLFSLKNFMLLI